jgi:meso-butanediol dehydrogenase / (S,S)-butanediol dehydrogenase / diacetyl reductase
MDPPRRGVNEGTADGRDRRGTAQLMTNPDLTDRIAVVTGAGSGFGAAMAHEFARAGMAVAVLDIDGERADETAAALAGIGARAHALRVDVGDPASIRDAAQRVGELFGGCDLLCANVGVQQFGSIDRLTDDDWNWVLGVNVLGTIRTVAAFLPLIRQRRGWRQISLTASSGVLLPAVRLGAYTTSKFAVMGYGETLRLELAGEGIGVTLVLPSGMITRHLESSAAARPEAFGASVTMPDDIEAMLSSQAPSVDLGIATPEDAARQLLPQLLANEPYVITHGSYRAEYDRRRAEMDRAFDRMERTSTESG